MVDTQSLGHSWLDVEAVALGDGLPGAGSRPVWHVKVAGDFLRMARSRTLPRLRLDLYGNDEYTFRIEAIAWRRFVAVGYGHRVYLVALEERSPARVINLGGDFSYFSRFHPLEDLLLVASGDGVCCVDDRGEVAWQRELGIDGVVIHSVESGLVTGSACQDPPDLWTPFRVALTTGADVDWNLDLARGGDAAGGCDWLHSSSSRAAPSR